MLSIQTTAKVACGSLTAVCARFIDVLGVMVGWQRKTPQKRKEGVKNDD
jgi:hypothetical protein